MTLHDLLIELTSGDDRRAEAAASSVSSYGSNALAILGPLLHSSEADFRWWAARGLAELMDERAGAYLIQALADENLSVQQCAALSLSKRPDPRAVPALVEAMASKDALLARLAANALACTGAEAVPALLDVLENGSQPMRLEAARALASIGDQRSIPALFKALGEDSALMEYWANEALERMGVGMMYFNP
jgi:HEAT repeat protein